MKYPLLVLFAMPCVATGGVIAVTDGDVAASAGTCTLAQAIYAANLANNPTNATPAGATTVAPLSQSATTSVGIGTCTGATSGANTIDLDAIAGEALQFTANDNFWYGPNALPPIASDITIEGRGVVLEIPGGTLRRRFFFIGAHADGVRTPGYSTPGAGTLTLRDIHLRGGRQLGGSSGYGGGGGGFGGALYNQGTLHLEGSTLSDNRATGGSASGSSRYGGGGMGENASDEGGFGHQGGGMGGALPSGSAESGQNAQGLAGGAGGGADSGLAGQGGGLPSNHTTTPGPAGNGGGGGGPGSSSTFFSSGGGGAGFGGGIGGNNNVHASDSGGRFGQGGRAFNSGNSGGGGGAGGGGGGVYFAAINPWGGGGGGFGAGGGAGGNTFGGGDGGFGGGGGTGYFSELRPPSRGGFAGGDSAEGVFSFSLGASGGGGAGLGGALFNHFGVVTARNVTFSGNSAIGGTGTMNGRGLGGAIFNLNGEIDVDQGSFVDNTADAGSALHSIGYNGSLTAGSRHAGVTIVRSLFSGGSGGDLRNELPPLSRGAVNRATNSMTVHDSLLQDPSGLVLPIGGASNNLVGQDPQLGPLQDNGGPTPTHLPAADSVVIDAVDCATPDPGVDQRGVIRPQGTRCDIGAVEPTAASYVLDVSVSGVGTVAAAPTPTPLAGGIGACSAGSGSCSATYAFADTTTLTATPAAGHRFVAWGGDCSAAGSTLQASVTLSRSRLCSATFTRNDVGVVSFGSLTGLVAAEGSGSDRALAIPLNLSLVTKEPVIIGYTLAAVPGGTGTVGTDIGPGAGTVIFEPGSTSTTLSLTIAGDNLVEPDESFTLTFTLLSTLPPGHTMANATLAPAVADGLAITLQNDDSAVLGAPTLTQTQDSGLMRFPLSLSAPVQTGFIVDYTTIDDTAIAGEDYIATSGSLVHSGQVDANHEVVVPLLNANVTGNGKAFDLGLAIRCGFAPCPISVIDGRGTITDSPSRIFRNGFE